MALLDSLKNIWHGVKNTVSGWLSDDDTEAKPQTLNEQIQTWTINNTNINTATRNDTLTSSFANKSLSDVASQINRENAQDYAPDIPQWWFLNPNETELSWGLDNAIAKEKEKESESWVDTLNRWGNNISKFANKIIDSYKADAESQEVDRKSVV